MHALRRHVAQAMLVVMVVSSCPTAQAIDWDYWSECVSEKQKQFSNQIKKHKVVIAYLMGVAVVAIGGYAYLRKCVEERAQKLLQPSQDYGVDTNDRCLYLVGEYQQFRLSSDINRMDSFTGGGARFFCSNATMNKLKEHKEDLEGLKQRVDNYYSNKSGSSTSSSPTSSRNIDID